jgi:hypothetical protein
MEPMYYIGLDVHKRKISYCVKDSGGKIRAEGFAIRFSVRTWNQRGRMAPRARFELATLRLTAEPPI